MQVSLQRCKNLLHHSLAMLSTTGADLEWSSWHSLDKSAASVYECCSFISPYKRLCADWISASCPTLACESGRSHNLI